MTYKNDFKSTKQGGFTLLEILIVIIILGILAALAIPVYSAVREKAVKQEAYQQLTAVREAELRYNSAHGTYTNSFTNLEFNPNDVNPGVTSHYNYPAPTATTTTFTATAVRLTAVPPTTTAYTVTIDQAGAITGG